MTNSIFSNELIPMGFSYSLTLKSIFPPSLFPRPDLTQAPFFYSGAEILHRYSVDPRCLDRPWTLVFMVLQRKRRDVLCWRERGKFEVKSDKTDSIQIAACYIFERKSGTSCFHTSSLHRSQVEQIPRPKFHPQKRGQTLNLRDSLGVKFT